MAKLRSKQTNTKIKSKSDPTVQNTCCSEQYPWFSFRYMTKNAKYNLKALPEGHARELTLLSLYNRLEELSKQKWLYWEGLPKATGLETIEHSRMYFKENTDLIELSADVKLYVFRFDTYKGSGKGRIIGYKESPCAVMHVIGFDFDFNSYDH